MLTKQQRRNCHILATEVLPEVPDAQFDMRRFGQHTADCGTVGCALGWAAMSGRIPRLQYGVYNPFNGRWLTSADELRQVVNHDLLLFSPVVEGKIPGRCMYGPEAWRIAGVALFGYVVYRQVFLRTDLSKNEVITQLLAFANGERT